tara:strand:+ start:2262 stop:3371 length:1110 start_codon:yes stop_codon:yes gene_type:complete
MFNKYKFKFLKNKNLIIFFIILGFNSVDLLAKNIFLSRKEGFNNSNLNKKILENNNLQDTLIASIKWIKIEDGEIISEEKINWEKTNKIEEFYPSKQNLQNIRSISSLNRSIIFNDYIVGPDVSWMVPPGFSWNGIYSFDSSIRGYSRRKESEKFLGFNGGDAVGQFYYQFLKKEKYSFGINLGVRSVYDKEDRGVSGSSIGEGLSTGFRLDYAISNKAGVAFGAEQLLHFDGLTDTGRDIYATISKAWWKDDKFPINVATAGFGTGKLAEGNIKGLCSNLLGGSGTEIAAQRSLCWAPIFSLARVHNHRHSTFFEYNSKLFLIGSSYSPFEEIPIRGTFAIVLSDHIDNYKLRNFDDLTWVFRLSAGF